MEFLCTAGFTPIYMTVSDNTTREFMTTGGAGYLNFVATVSAAVTRTMAFIFG